MPVGTGHRGEAVEGCGGGVRLSGQASAASLQRAVCGGMPSKHLRLCFTMFKKSNKKNKKIGSLISKDALSWDLPGAGRPLKCDPKARVLRGRAAQRPGSRRHPRQADGAKAMVTRERERAARRAPSGWAPP